MNAVYKEWKEEHIGRACSRRPFLVSGPSKWVAGYDLAGNEILTGTTEIIPSPEFDCRIIDFRSVCRLLGAYSDSFYPSPQNLYATLVSMFLNSDELCSNVPAYTLFNQLNAFTDPVLTKSDTNANFDPIYFGSDTLMHGCELSDMDFRKRPLYVRAGEKISFQFTVSYIGPSVSNTLPFGYEDEALKNLPITVFCETLV